MPGVQGDFTTLTITCRNDHSHTRTVYTDAEKIAATAATCTAEGSETYRMSYEVDGQKHVLADTVTYALPMVPHSWSAWELVSSGADDRNDPGHTWTTTELQQTSAGQVKAATCAAGGGELIRITVTADGKTHVLGEEVIDTTPASGHKWGKWTTLSETSSKMVRERTCSVCGQAERIDFTAAPMVTAANTADGIQLTWTEVTSADAYRVYYREHGGSWKVIGHTTKLTYTWKWGKDGTKYEFTVRGCAISGKTKTVMPGKYNTSETIQFVKAPAVTVKAVKDGIQVSWTKVAGADTYRVYYKTAGGAWKAIGHNKNLRYIWRHGEAGVSYQFTVRPCTVKGATKTLFGAGYNTSKSVTFPG